MQFITKYTTFTQIVREFKQIRLIENGLEGWIEFKKNDGVVLVFNIFEI